MVYTRNAAVIRDARTWSSVPLIDNALIPDSTVRTLLASLQTSLQRSCVRWTAENYEAYSLAYVS